MTSPATQPSGSVRRAETGLRLAGRYELQRPIASGGMAQVWAAQDHVLGRRVAVKILHPHLGTDDSFLQRFRREALAAARLRHPSIVAVYDTVSEPGLEAIVMELSEGRTLRQLMDEGGQMAVVDVIDVASQVAEALDVAHRGGVVHRDIKPSNILISPGGRVLVTDFGIAKAGADNTDLTLTGSLLGTAKYLAPEQVTGDPVDPRADLYALGVVMFEALCGRPPFRGDTDAATALARLHHDPPRPRSFRPEVPRSLEHIVLRSLSRRPEDRWSWATELRAALAQVRCEEPDDAESPTVVATRPAPPPPPGPSEDDHPGFIRSERSWLVPAFLVVLAAAALGISGALFTQTSVGRDLVDRGLGRQAPGSTVPTTPTVVTDGEALTGAGLVAEVRTHDPFGDGRERDDQRDRVLDDDPETYWSTETYQDPDLAGGGFKPGVGLVLALSGAGDLRTLEVQARTEGWRAEVYVGNDFGADPSAWGSPVAAGASLGRDVRFDLQGHQGSAVLLWITHTGGSPDGSGGSANRTEITAVRVS